jgi:hypothetical protein
MNPKYFGDSYDIVKHCLLRWLASLGPWQVHPMFTQTVTVEQAESFSTLLGVGLVSTRELAPNQDRNTFVEEARSCKSHLFLDPDTGVSIAAVRGKKAPAYLFVDELVQIACRQKDLLTLVFDQSLPRGKERKGLEDKLKAFASRELPGFAYRSHACFLVVGPDLAVVRQAREILGRDGHLPNERFVVSPSYSAALQPEAGLFPQARL